MEIQQVINGAQRHINDAQGAVNSGRADEAKDSLAEAAGLIQREIGDKDAADENTEAKEEKAQTPGHCQPDQAHEAGS